MDSQLIAILVNAGVAGVIVVLFVCGYIVPKSVVTDLKAELGELKQALAAERDRADAAVAAAGATRDVLAAIQLGRQLGPSAAGDRDRDGP